MAQVGDDCYFFYYSSCKKGPACPFRHSAPALGKEEVCPDWAKGSCIVPNCARRHMVIQKDRGSMPCYWESQPVGCTKPFCPFKHLKPRPGAPPQTGQGQPTNTHLVTSIAPTPQGKPVNHTAVPQGGKLPVSATNQNANRLVQPPKGAVAVSADSSPPVQQQQPRSDMQSRHPHHHHAQSARPTASRRMVPAAAVAVASTRVQAARRAAVPITLVVPDCDEITSSTRPRVTCNVGPAQALSSDFKLRVTVPGDRSAQRGAPTRTIGNSQERPRHPRTQGIATDSTAADSSMDMRRATPAMSRNQRVDARDRLNQLHGSETARRGPRPLLPTKRTAPVQQEEQTKPLAKRHRPEVEVKADTFKVQSLNEIRHANGITKKPVSIPSSSAQRQASSSAQRQTSSSQPLQSSGLSVKELRAKRFAKQQELQQQRRQDTEQEERREPRSKVHASTKPLPLPPVEASKKPAAVPAATPAPTSAGLRIKSLDEIRAEKRKHQETTSDNTISAAETCQRKPAETRTSTIQRSSRLPRKPRIDAAISSTSKESPAVVSSSVSKSVCSPVLSTTPTKSSTPAAPPAKITRSSRHSSAKKETPVTTKVSQSEGSEATTTTTKSDAKSGLDSLDDIDLLDDDAFEKAMKELVGDVSYDDMNEPDLDGTVNDDDLLLEAELMI
ncbi:zinc finger CCCH domain-containing protein 11B-like [Sycon ciliatum]|uniref:zinc finger CCCH domain-containing protein 11B-like n=1 Tax=Sycon ciliatum TaxID=27933 RepID=UPI0031F6A6D0